MRRNEGMTIRRPKPIRKPETYDMFGILNAQGSLWSRHTFAERDAAEKYLREHDLNQNCDLAKHKVVPVRVTIEIATAVKP
jgi:hypothetical protein